MRTTGNDLTIVSSGAGMMGVLEATAQLQKVGMKVEAIDLRSLKPMDTETLVKSVQKTKRLLTFDQSYYTLSPGAEVIARVAENVDGARYKRIAFPDAPPPRLPKCSTGCGRTPATSWRPRPSSWANASYSAAGRRRGSAFGPREPQGRYKYEYR